MKSNPNRPAVFNSWTSNGPKEERPCVGYGSNRSGDAAGSKMAQRILVRRLKK